LSSFAGASRELAEAVIVNPYDAHGMADAFDLALRMSPEAQRLRIRAMRDLVRQRNVHLWAGQMLLDAARLRRRAAVAATVG
jgi:trehalose 6-phosphate synthase